MMDDQTDDQDNLSFTPAQQLMAHAHEMFTTAMESGFSHGEALYIMSAMICGGPRIPTENQ